MSSGLIIDADLLLDEIQRLWALETYRDRHGKTRLRMTLRFSAPRVRIELGIIAEELAAALKGRKRQGRWKHSRDAAVALRPFVDAIAASYRRLKSDRKEGAEPRKKAGVKSKQGSRAGAGNQTKKRGPLGAT